LLDLFAFFFAGEPFRPQMSPNHNWGRRDRKITRPPGNMHIQPFPVRLIILFLAGNQSVS